MGARDLDVFRGVAEHLGIAELPVFALAVLRGPLTSAWESMFGIRLRRGAKSQGGAWKYGKERPEKGLS